MKARAAVTPIVLVVLAVAAAAYAYLVDRRTISDADRAARRTEVFPSFRLDEVARIELDHGTESTVLERAANASANGAAAWTMTSPRHESADAAAVDTLLRELELATRVRQVDSSEAAGLDAPRVRGRVKMGALDYHFALGGDAPRPDGAAYMSLEGEGTFVVPRSLKVQLLRTADAYRDHALVPYGESEVARVELHSETSGFAVERKGTTFRTAGIGLRASRAAMDKLFAALADTRAESFLDDARADTATTPPAWKLTIAARGADRPPVELVIGGACPGQEGDVTVVRSAPTRVSACVAKGVVDTLRAIPDALPDDSPLFAHADELEELRLESVAGGPPRIDLARHGSGWHERAPEDRDLGSDESDSANALASALAAARGTGVHRPRGDEPFTARTRVTAVRTGAGTTEVVELSAPGPDGTVLVHRIDDGAFLRLSAAAARRFEPHPVALRSRPIWRPSFDPGSVVTIDDGCGPVAQHLELDGHTWKLRAPAGFTADPISTADLAAAVAHAKADAWITEKDDGSFGLDKPGACTVTLTVRDAADDARTRRASLVFGSEADGGYYARTLDDPAVFVAPKVLRQMLAHPAIDRSRMRLDPASLGTVTLVRGSARRAVGRDSDDAKLAVALGGLYALAALHPGPPAANEAFEKPTLEIDATARSEAGAPAERRVVIGAPTTVDGADAYFARVSGVDATFAVPRKTVDDLLDAW